MESMSTEYTKDTAGNWVPKPRRPSLACAVCLGLTRGPGGWFRRFCPPRCRGRRQWEREARESEQRERAEKARRDKEREAQYGPPMFQTTAPSQPSQPSPSSPSSPSSQSQPAASPIDPPGTDTCGCPDWFLQQLQRVQPLDPEPRRFRDLFQDLTHRRISDSSSVSSSVPDSDALEDLDEGAAQAAAMTSSSGGLNGGLDGDVPPSPRPSSKQPAEQHGQQPPQPHGPGRSPSHNPAHNPSATSTRALSPSPSSPSQGPKRDDPPSVPPALPSTPRQSKAATAAMQRGDDLTDSQAQTQLHATDIAPPHSKDVAMPDAPAPADDAVEHPDDQQPHPQPQTTPVQPHLPNHNLNNSLFSSSQQPYTPSHLSIDPQTYMLLLASMHQRANQMSPPPTVTPSQVTLPSHIDEAIALSAAHPIHTENTAEKSLEAFARIEFADSVFQMTTYSVIIGRDQGALAQARRDEQRAEKFRKQAEENERKGLPPPEPIVQDRTRFSKSYVSEEGGMLGPESDSDGNSRPAKRRKVSTAGSSQKDHDEARDNMMSNRQYIPHTPGAAAVDLASLRPSPWHVAFLGIHSPGPNIASKTKAISREHLKISFNQKEGVFEAIPLHKNGFFCEDVHYKAGRVVLRCGDRLQIKDVDFRFLINGVERGRTGAEEFEERTKAPKKRSQGGKEMSFDFESAHGEGAIQDTSDELSDLPSQPELSDINDEDAEEDEDVEKAEDEQPDAEEPPAETPEVTETAETPETPAPPAPMEGIPEHLQQVVPQVPKKRGPGRPPKNGVMSKREQRLLKKQQQEMAKKTLPQVPPAEPPVKRKVGRPRKHPLPEDGSERPEKRKYKPRKPKGEDGAEGSDAERRAKEKKEKKTRPKSPPLELVITDYTEEQLQKPNKNYGVLIDEALTAAGPSGLTLKQIYKRIASAYPWFYFHTETKGWESSVRHNLIGNEAFRKDETTNTWSRVPGVELDAGKKRKANSPDRLANQPYGAYPYPYNTAQHMPHAGAAYPQGQAPPGYQVPGYNSQQQAPAPAPAPATAPAPAQAPTQAHRPMQPYAAAPAAAPGQQQPPAQPAASQLPAPAQLPPGYAPPPAPPAPARPPLAGQQPGTYSSPYTARPPPPTTAAVKVEEARVAAPVPAPAPPPVRPPPAVLPPGAKPPYPGQPPAPPHAVVPPAAHGAPRPVAAPVPVPPARPVIDPRLLQAVVGLKNGLVENLKKARNPKAEAIVMSALNRCIGLKKEATENETMEAICMKGIRQVIDGACKTKSPTPGGSPAADAIPPVLEQKVLQSLNDLKDVSVGAIKSKLGEAKAEAVALSAIDRVLGLADASIVPAEGQGGNFEGVEQHLMKSIRQLLTGMNQKLRDPPTQPATAAGAATA